MKKLIIILVPVILLLGGGGAGAYWFLFMRKPADAVPKEEPIGPTDALRLESIGVPLVIDKKLGGYLHMQVMVVVQIKDFDFVRPRLAEVQDALIRDLNKRPFTVDPVSEALIQERSLAVAKRILGPKVALDIKVAKVTKGT
ncbi:MAG: hypothetical protein FJX46_14780 [Alphaproteobacteria bacterium]|nr:hypothetical protein [Alphaproteobacteria bacterium]